MNALLQIALSNAAVCGVMTVLLLPAARWLRRPAVTHAICVLILLKLLTPPLVNVPVIRHATAQPAPRQQATSVDAVPSHRVWNSLAVPADSAEMSAPSPGDDASFESASRLSIASPVSPPSPAPQLSRSALTRIWENAQEQWRSWLLTCWIASSLALGAFTLHRIIGLAGTVRRATVSGHDITPEVELLCKRLGIRRVPRVRFILGSSPPMLLALFCRPELVIPIHLWDRLDHRQRQTLLLHELAHFRRRDHWVRYLELLATWVYWWHFATWFARRALHEAEEHCCDAWVVWAMPDSSRAYMTTLLDAVDFLSQRARPRLAAAPVLASGMGQFHNLQRRLTMVRERNTQRRLGGGGLAAVILLSAIALPLGAKVASGDDRSAAQPAADPTAATDLAVAQSHVLAAAADPLALDGAAPTTPADAAPLDPTRAQSAGPQEDVAKLEAELAAARKNVERLQRQLDQVKTRSGERNHRSREARLGYMHFKYQQTGSGGTLSAFDDSRLMWTLNVPLNAASGIRCYDNDTLLIKSADGYARLVRVEDGQVIRAWAPGVGAPTVGNSHQVNPFGPSAAPANAAPAALPDMPGASPRNDQDQEKRMERMEESIRALTEAVNQLTRDQKEQRSSSAPRGR